MTKKTFKIEGMHCASCATSIGKAVGKVKGVKTARANIATNKLYVECDHSAKEEEIKKAVSKVGDYKALSENPERTQESTTGNQTTIFIVQGLDNPHCSMTVETVE